MPQPLSIIFLLTFLAGCAAEVAGTAATTVKAEEARAAEHKRQEVMQRYQQQLDAALQIH